MYPLLAHVYEPHRVTYPCYVQPKLNGIRALYQNGYFQSREEFPFSPGLLDHLAKPLLEVFGPEIILDGELYVHGWALQRINAAVTPIRQLPTEDTKLVEYHVFDAADFKTPFEQRRLVALQCLNLKDKRITRVLTVKVNSEAAANEAYSIFVSQGYEGMMYRLGDCPYTVPKQTTWKGKSIIECDLNGRNKRTKFLSDQDNRVWHLLKRKDFQDDEFLITGFNTTTGPKGERGFQLHLITSSGKRFASGGGLTHSEIDYYISKDPTGRKAKIKYLVLSSEGIPTGNPTILAIL